MPISATRLERDLATIASFTATPGAGASRPTFSPSWAQARDYVIAEAERAGCAIRVDAAGNVHARPRSLALTERVWLSGSHLDSVPNGGNFDGVVGVVVALEALRAAHDAGQSGLPLELVVFAEEEGTTFGLGMLGSRSWLGTLDVAELASLRNAGGESYLDAGDGFGVCPVRLATERFDAALYRGLIEVHIEQGPALWNSQQAAAVVTAINGRRQYRVRLEGHANHAGSTSMADRRDALAGAAEMIRAVEELAYSQGPHAVATVGQIACEPNAINVIPGVVTFSIDCRAPSDQILDHGDHELRRRLESIASARKLRHELTTTEALPTITLDREVCDLLRRAAQRLGVANLPETTSGALHDAAILAPSLPTAMLFIASRDGISHHPTEFSRLDDIAWAARLLLETVAPGSATTVRAG